MQDLDISWESVVWLQTMRGAPGKEGVRPLTILCMKQLDEPGIQRLYLSLTSFPDLETTDNHKLLESIYSQY